METLMVKYVPDLMDQLSELLPQLAQFYGGGLLIAVMLWVIGYTVLSAFGLLQQVSS